MYSFVSNLVIMASVIFTLDTIYLRLFKPRYVSPRWLTAVFAAGLGFVFWRFLGYSNLDAAGTAIGYYAGAELYRQFVLKYL